MQLLDVTIALSLRHTATIAKQIQGEPKIQLADVKQETVVFPEHTPNN